MDVDEYIDGVIDLISVFPIISFDVFDTLLIRPYSRPSDLFRHMEESMHLKGFARKRIMAERSARRKKRNEVVIEEIYAELNGFENRDSIIEAEIATEKRQLSCNPIAKRLYDYAIRHDKLVVIVSDTYFDNEFIADVLHGNGYEKIDMIFASSDVQLRKSKGDIWEKVICDLHADPKMILHIGDNRRSDFVLPKKHGINTFWLKTCKDFLFESDHRMKAMSKLGSLGASEIVGLSQNIVLERNYWFVFGYLYSSVFSYAFVRWILDNAIKDNVDHIVFVARDGYIPKIVFDRINKSMITTSYIYLNRSVCGGSEKKTLSEYIRSHIPDNAGRIAIVDATSINRTSERTVRSLANENIVVGYYFRLEVPPVGKMIHELVDRNKNKSVSFVKEYQLGMMCFSRSSTNIVEFVLSSPECEIKGINSSFDPIYDCSDRQYAGYRQKAYDDMVKGALFWIDSYIEKFGENIDLSSRDVAKLITRLCFDNNNDDYEHFMRFRHCDGDRGFRVMPLWRMKGGNADGDIADEGN